MTYSLSFLPEVENDAIAGYAWYEDQSIGLGEDFLRLFYAYSTEIPRNPLLFPIVYKDFRRRLLRRFPYAIYFRIEERNVVVFGLFHCARNPSFIQGSLSGRAGK
jgi:toxin ParE1/3/4